MKKVLLIAYHFPPVKVSSGLQRTLSFSKDLITHGWLSQVLTVHPRAYETSSEDQLADIPEQVEVIRAFSLDSAKHFSIKNRYPGFLALPDRWITWWIGGVLSGLLAIRRSRPSVIWSTYPIATAHLIGLTLHKLTGIPWVADFRDSMTEDDYPSDPTRRKVCLWIEKMTVHSCSRAVFTTPGAIKMYRARYPGLPDDKWALIPNGYNEQIFAEVEHGILQLPQTSEGDKTTIVHSGVVYPSERDPRPLFSAIANLKTRGEISSESFCLILRATGHDAIFQPWLNELGIDDIVKLEPGLPYRKALEEMLQADGLLILQAASCNHQIPAKLYEYFRAKRPILALTDKDGDTANAMRNAGIESIAPLDNVDQIAEILLLFVAHINDRTKKDIASNAAVIESSRSASANFLAQLLTELC